jgi:hypothetical protein
MVLVVYKKVCGGRMSIKNNVIALPLEMSFFAFFLASLHIEGATREEAKIDE